MDSENAILKNKAKRELLLITAIVGFLKNRINQGRYNQATGARLVKLPDYTEVMLIDIIIGLYPYTPDEIYTALIRLQVNGHIVIKDYLDYEVNYDAKGKGYLNQRVAITKEGEISVDTGFYEEAYLKRIKINTEYKTRHYPTISLWVSVLALLISTAIAVIKIIEYTHQQR